MHTSASFASVHFLLHILPMLFLIAVMSEDRQFHAFPINDLERSVLDTCALRLDGWRLMDDIAREQRIDSGNFTPFVTPVVEERVFHEDERLNFLAFFALQRSLGKWEGVYDGPDSDSHIAFRLLFLHLYRQPVPRGYEYADYARRWEVDFAPRAEQFAATIRQTFTRRSHPPQGWSMDAR